jgi:hypothetical protein
MAANDPMATGKKLVHLDAVGRKANVHIRFENVAKVFRLPRLIDFLEIASYVYSADCATPRGTKWIDDDSTEPWRRDFSFVISVREPEFWGRAEIQCLMEEILSTPGPSNPLARRRTPKQSSAGRAFCPFQCGIGIAWTISCARTAENAFLVAVQGELSCLRAHSFVLICSLAILNPLFAAGTPA